MIQEKIQLLKFFNHLFDLIIITASIYVAVLTERFYHNQEWIGFRSESFDFLLLPVLLIIWSLLINLFEKVLLYRRDSYSSLLFKIVAITILGITTIIAFDFILKQKLFYRSTIIFFGIISFFCLAIKRIGLKLFLSSIRTMGMDNKNILILGRNENSIKLAKEIDRHQEYGLLIQAIVDVEGGNKDLCNEYKVIKEEDVYNKIFSIGIDEVFITIPIDKVDNSIIMLFNNLGISYHIILDVSQFSASNKSMVPKVIQQYNFPMLSFHMKSAKLYLFYIKNIWEKLLSLLLFTLLLPLIVLFGLLIKLDSKGPIIFKQKRIGLHGRKFTQYKLRSMVEDADSLKANLRGMNEQSGPVFKSSIDPRITRIGKIIRKYSIDETPQLFNVIRGDMNLIGPRPPIPEEVEKYKSHHFRRLSVKPGITGLWQISGRNSIKSFDDWVKLDLEYIDNWSLFNDLIIACKTIPVIIRGSGR